MEEEVKASTWHRNPFGPFKDEILSQIILPKILNLLDDGTVSSKTDLLSKFKETHNATISMTTFDEWLSSLGIKFDRVTQVKLPKGMTRPIERQEEMKQQQEGLGMAPSAPPTRQASLSVEEAEKLFDPMN